MSDEIILRAHRLSAAYGRRTVLHDIDLEVGSGEFWFLLGPNGSGKTTFLRSILGLTPIRGGELWLHPRLGGRERIGYVPQRSELNATLPITVREFVLLGLVGTRVRRREAHTRLGWALARVGLAGMEPRNYWSLSGGQRQRALVARALVRRPDLLVLDEPMNHLDRSTQDTLLRFLAELNREHRLTLLFVTHDLDVAERHATHVALFEDGSVLAGPRDLMLARARLPGAPADLDCEAAARTAPGDHT